jgi:hypothetical protein
MRNVIREAIEWPGFSFVDITSQCIENNGRRIGFASANEMLTFYRKTYKRAPKDAEVLEPFQIGVVYPMGHVSRNGNGANGDRPAALPDQPSGPMTSAIDSPGEAGATAPEAATPAVERSDAEKARRRAESQERARLMAQLPAEVKLRVAQKELSLVDALAQASLEIPEFLRTGASAPSDAPLPSGVVERSATGTDPESERKPELDAQKAEAAAEGRDLIGGVPGGDTQPAHPRTSEDARPATVADDPKAQQREEAKRKAALMARLPSELKLSVAKREISLADALAQAGIEDPEASGTG